MRLGALTFLAGILVLHTLVDLPSPWWVLGLPVVLVIGLYVPGLRLPAWLGLGFLWALLWAQPLSHGQLPLEAESAEWQAEGWVASIPETLQRGVRFQFTVDALSQGDVHIPFTGRLRLTSYKANPASLRVGDKWQFTVRLNRTHGLANPGSFDYERWLLVNGIAAQGHVLEHPEPRLLEPAARYYLDRFRQELAERFWHLLPDNPYVGILVALAVGESHGIQERQWEIFSRTGTGHLMSISGSHIGLVAGLIFWVVRQCWIWFPALVRRWPASKAAALTALLGAGAYTLLSGLSVPSQRSFIMIAVAMAALLGQRPVVPSHILALALLAVLVIDPLAPLAAGFWLSFGAVAIILYTVTGRGGVVKPLREWLGLQLAITLALVPATLIFFQQIPILSPPANLIAIPWTSITVLPLTLLAMIAGLVSETAQTGLLQLAALTMDWLWRFLIWLGRSPWALVYHPAPPLWTLAFAVPGVLLLVAPWGMPGRWLGGVLCLPLIFFPLTMPAPGGIWFTLLDVGQGLSAVVRTAQHVLVYDTGPRRGRGFDAGRVVLVPFLRQQGIRRLNALIISHADTEHLGGTRSLLENVKADRILTASPQEVPIEGAQPCQAGDGWTWDGVRFSILHPPEGERLSGNNASCVLRVEGSNGQVLLTGDIEPAAQAALVDTYGAALAAEVLVAPSHGGGGLPLADFLAAVQPRYVLFSTGYNNRAGFPRAETVECYREAGATVLDTVSAGAITFHLDGWGGESVPALYRQQARRYWRADP